MKLGFIGLGRMGHNMVERLLEKGHEVVAFDVSKEAIEAAQNAGARGTSSLQELIENLEAPRTVWLMVPRAHVQGVLDEFVPLLSDGDTIIEGGNTYYEDSMRRAAELQKKEINFMDVGVSGGISGARHGASMMVGGSREIFETLEPLFADLCVPEGYGYMGKSGAGHFVKMVHNAIEYGMMGAIAEGLSAIKERVPDFGTDLGEVVKVYGHGSIIAGRLITEWLSAAWKDDPGLASFDETVPYGETEEEMEKLLAGAPLPVLKAALAMRALSRENPSFAAKIINALRKYFGGHTKETASKK